MAVLVEWALAQKARVERSSSRRFINVGVAENGDDDDDEQGDALVPKRSLEEPFLRGARRDADPDPHRIRFLHSDPAVRDMRRKLLSRNEHTPLSLNKQPVSPPETTLSRDLPALETTTLSFSLETSSLSLQTTSLTSLYHSASLQPEDELDIPDHLDLDREEEGENSRKGRSRSNGSDVEVKLRPRKKRTGRLRNSDGTAKVWMLCQARQRRVLLTSCGDSATA